MRLDMDSHMDMMVKRMNRRSLENVTSSWHKMSHLHYFSSNMPLALHVLRSLPGHSPNDVRCQPILLIAYISLDLFIPSWFTTFVRNATKEKTIQFHSVNDKQTNMNF